MKRIIILSFIIVLANACQKKAENNPSPINNTEKEQGNSQENTVANVTASHFDDIQKLVNTKSDTVYVTNYWATWCPPCIAEIPHFVELQNQYKNKKVKFVFVNVDNPEDTQTEVIPFVTKHQMKNVFQINPEEMQKIASIDAKLGGGIPVTVIQKGNHKEGFLGSLDKETLTSKINEYSNKK